jgi:flagellar biosynthesis/type III secretory pathway M-ring protein FliF/YscJ
MDFATQPFIFWLALFTIVAVLVAALVMLARVRRRREQLGETREEHIPTRERRPGEGLTHPVGEHSTARERAPGARGAGSP